jgi:hypothetical protein
MKARKKLSPWTNRRLPKFRRTICASQLYRTGRCRILMKNTANFTATFLTGKRARGFVTRPKTNNEICQTNTDTISTL